VNLGYAGSTMVTIPLPAASADEQRGIAQGIEEEKND
jgi:hypothetical protein